MTPETPEPLDRPAREGARRLLLAELEHARRARAGLGDDDEALHDLRVALRRFRSLARALEDEADLDPKARRRLRRLARATGAARDAEVLCDWLRRLAPRVPRTGSAAVERLEGTLGRRLEAAREKTLARLPRAFDRLAGRLADRLATFRVELGREGADPNLVDRLAAAIPDHRRALAETLAAARHGGLEVAHLARIRGKRLRYLIEPLVPRCASAARAVEVLKRLQDELGEVQDLRVLAAVVADEAAAAERSLVAAVASGEPAPADPQPDAGAGWRTLARRIGQESGGRRRRAQRTWLAQRGAGRRELELALDALEGELSGRSAAPPPA